MALEDTVCLVFLEEGGKGEWCGRWQVEMERKKESE